MTEEEWMASVDLTKCIRGIPKDHVKETRLRRLAIALCQRCRKWLSPDCCLALDAAEGCLDGTAKDGERRALAEVMEASYLDLAISRSRNTADGTPTIHELAAHAIHSASAWEERSVYFALGSVTTLAKMCKNDRECVALVREVHGNPFRHVAFDPRWQTVTVQALAIGIYTDCAFDRMPILADALEEAGCDNADILNHCRGPRPHVRGCWVVDLLLGKS